MRRYRTGAHAKYDLKVHIVWVPKYRKRVLTGPVAVRVRDLLRQIATENDLHIISGKVSTARASLYAATKFGLRGFALRLDLFISGRGRQHGGLFVLDGRQCQRFVVLQQTGQRDRRSGLSGDRPGYHQPHGRDAIA